MKYNGYKYILLTLILTITGLLVWAFNYEGKRVTFKASQNHINIKRVYSEKELIARLEKTLIFLSPKADEQLLKGKIEFKEIESSKALNENPIDYTFSRRGNEFYYRMGNVEYFNNKKIAVVVDREQLQIKVLKAVALSSLNMPMMNLGQLPELIKSEGYKLTATEKGNIQTVTLKNEYHFTCREYTLTFDTIGYMPKRIFARFTGTANTGQAEGEKHLRIELDEANGLSNIESYMIKMPLKQQGSKWKVIPEYENYQVFGL